ncbi:MAG: penicillin-binding transpeptidase domain-containing protein [Proteobacteria bacterium]|nr:penicillin-binding transpeptidase domain-containing protein [Pseudomonadota bacterium]
MDLQLTNKEFLQDRGDARYLRTIKTPTHRGMIMDRNGEPLAISTPVYSATGQPRIMLSNTAHWREIAEVLGTTVDHLEALIAPRSAREFVYLKRHLSPQVAESLRAANFPGVRLLEEQRRYYPTAEVTAHTVGFTNVDDAGQEGIELAFDDTLSGEQGSRKVLKDRLGRIVEYVEQIKPTVAGRDLALSIDKRIQYIAYRELKIAVQAHDAEAGSMVIIDPNTGEVLALVNQPSFNPNNRGDLIGENYRNRAVTDTFEPGSTMKPMTIAAALESGQYEPETPINTAPGYFRVGRHLVTDAKNFGQLDVGGVITKSSNVGASKIALSLEPELLWKILNGVGFGTSSGIGLPGEATGHLGDARNWGDIERATVAFGYGISVNAMQLARAYSVLATDGILRPLSIIKLDTVSGGERIISVDTSRKIKRMMETVTTEGTAKAAAIAGYHVAGKTGTVHKSVAHGYAEHRYLSIFAGMLPATRPELVAVVVIDEPKNGEYFGGRVAAPIFAKVMGEAARILELTPDIQDDADNDRYRLAGTTDRSMNPGAAQ